MTSPRDRHQRKREAGVEESQKGGNRPALGAPDVHDGPSGVLHRLKEVAPAPCVGGVVVKAVRQCRREALAAVVPSRVVKAHPAPSTRVPAEVCTHRQGAHEIRPARTHDKDTEATRERKRVEREVRERGKEGESTRWGGTHSCPWGRRGSRRPTTAHNTRRVRWCTCCRCPTLQASTVTVSGRRTWAKSIRSRFGQSSNLPAFHR